MEENKIREAKIILVKHLEKMVSDLGETNYVDVSEMIDSEESKYAIDAMIEFSESKSALNYNWISVENRLPICVESGAWDGKRSDFVLAIGKFDNPKVVRLYSGFLDGSNFNEFYDENDYEVSGVQKWMPISI